MSFFQNRFCKLIPGVSDIFGKVGAENIVKKGTDLLKKAPGMEPVSKEELFYIMETKGHLRDLEKKILSMQAGVARNELFLKIVSGNDKSPVVKKTIEFIINDEIEEAEEEVRRAMEEDPEETKRIVEKYAMSLPQILRAVESEEITVDEGTLRAEPFFKKNPFVLEASKQTGFGVDKMASVAAGVFIKTKEMPRSSTDLIGGLMDGMRSMMSLGVTKNAAKKIGIEKSTIRSVYGINVFEFSEIVKTLKEEISEDLFSGSVGEEDKKKLEKRLKNRSVHSTERRVINFILKNRNNPDEISKLYQYVVDENNIENTLSEIDKTFRKGGSLDGEKLSESEIRKKSVAYFQNELTIGKMLKTKFSVKENRETLASYTLASLFYTMPRAMRGNMRLKTINAIFTDKGVKGMTAEMQRRVKGSWFLGKKNAFNRYIKTIQAEKMYGYSAKGAEAGGDMTKMNKGIKAASRTTGMMRKLLGPGMLAASEVYNVSTNRSTVQESVGRFAGGILRFVPIIGTGLDFTEAISGSDQLNGQKLTGTERLARTGWGVLGLIGDFAMLIPGFGIAIKGSISSARVTRLARGSSRVVRTTALGVGVGAGVVAPLVSSKEMRGAVGAIGTIGVTGAKGVRAAFRLLTGPGGGALDADIAMSQFKDATVKLTKKGAKKVTETTKALTKKTKEFMEKYDDTIGSWGADAKARFTEYMGDKEQSSKLDSIKKMMDEKQYRIEDIFSDNTLSTVERHKKMSEYIENAKGGGEN